MNVTMVMVSSVNGRITREGEPDIYSWTSREDSKHFFSLVKISSLIVMGAKTYEGGKPHIRLTPKTLRVVLTRKPEQYRSQAVKGQLEFTDESPEALVGRMAAAGYKEMLLTGGGRINALFLKAGLVDEILLTIEPRVFGVGNNLVEGDDVDASLRLTSVKKLNARGTLLLHYAVHRGL